MVIKYHSKFGREVRILYPGEYFVSKKPLIIATLLGSCISVCLRDSKTNISGMNHFMLPGEFDNTENLYNKNTKYGVFAMEKLINDIMKFGGDKKNLDAKIFGGSNMLDINQSKQSISEINQAFVKKYLEMENIPIIAEDVGGKYGRKIFFFTNSGKVLLKRIKDIRVEKRISKKEEGYKLNLAKKDENERNKKSNFFIFE